MLLFKSAKLAKADVKNANTAICAADDELIWHSGMIGKHGCESSYTHRLTSCLTGLHLNSKFKATGLGVKAHGLVLQAASPRTCRPCAVTLWVQLVPANVVLVHAGDHFSFREINRKFE